MSNYLQSHLTYFLSTAEKGSKIKKMKVNRGCRCKRRSKTATMALWYIASRVKVSPDDHSSDDLALLPLDLGPFGNYKRETEILPSPLPLSTILDSLLFLGETLRFAETSCKITFFVRPKFVSPPMARADYKEYLLSCTIFDGPPSLLYSQNSCFVHRSSSFSLVKLVYLQACWKSRKKLIENTRN